jgi:hypothetical protein
MRRCSLYHAAGALVALILSESTYAQEMTRGPQSAYAPAGAFRSPVDYLQVHTGLIYTDNVLQTVVDKKGEALASAGFDVDYTHKGPRFEFDSRGAINWVEYLEHTYAGIASGALNAKALAGSSDDRLQWAAWETFGQLDTDPLAAPNPVNVENVNYLTTGPLLNFPLGQSNRLSLRGLYSNSHYQKSPYDSNSFDVGASLSHAVSTSSSISLDGDARRTDFRDPLVATDYEIRSAFLGYTATIARARFSAEAGYTTLHLHGTSSGSPLMSLGLERRISLSSTIRLQGQVGYSADTESIRTAAGLTTPGVAFADASTPSPIKQETGSLGWEFARPRTTVSIFSAITRQRYARQASLDQRNLLLELLVTRRLGPTMTAMLSAQRLTRRYSNLGADVTQTALIAGLSKTFTRMGLSLRYQKFHRGGSSSNSAMVGVYDENRVGLYVTYDLLGHHLTTPPLVER